MRRTISVCAALLAIACLPAVAAAHIERPSYWPDPAPDTSVRPATGGDFPRVRSLFTALDRTRPGATHVVCAGAAPRRSGVLAAQRRLREARRAPASRARIRGLQHRLRAQERRYASRVRAHPSMVRLRAAIARARAEGYRYRPSEDARTLTARQARRLQRFNERLLRSCRYDAIQAAVTASGNNDRVVVLPGIYTEPASRNRPTNDPECDKYETNSDYPQRPGASSYKYDFHCPNDANLVAVMGREPGAKDPPDPPLLDRHGIPDDGPCIRCNLQLEGSGVTADDVVIEAGDPADGNRGPSGVHAAKDVGVRADRADGFVLTNMTVRHAREHGIYVHEVDGYVLDRFKAFYSGLYGTLTFTSDHGIHQDCETVGHGDSGIYPGAPPETGEQRRPGTEARYNQEIRRCDSHHNLAGYSATNGNAVWIHHNRFYDNALGFQTDIATSAGHPGFPDDSQLIEDNEFFSNNFNPFDADSDVRPAFPFPVGTGLWIAGGNNHTIRRNRFWDNWRRGTMTFAVPDALICGPTTDNVQAGCDETRTSTSHRNRVYENVMGVAPDGSAQPNGTDFWWDAFPGNTANCWYANTGAAPITSSPASLPDCAGGTDPSSSTGTGDLANEGELIACLLAFEFGFDSPAGQGCPWFRTPPRPGSAAAREAEQQAYFRSAFIEFCKDGEPAPTCAPFETLLPGR